MFFLALSVVSLDGRLSGSGITSIASKRSCVVGSAAFCAILPSLNHWMVTFSDKKQNKSRRILHRLKSFKLKSNERGHVPVKKFLTKLESMRSKEV